MGHASIEETEGTYGHLVRQNHERDVEALDLVLWPRTQQKTAASRRSLATRPVPPRPHTSHSLPVSR
jgi:hypothetical protein